MISAEFRQAEGALCAFTVSGHAMFANYGQDIVCASVTSAVQLTANGITEVLHVPARVHVGKNKISLTLPPDAPAQAGDFLEALRLHLSVLAESYPDHIRVINLEVSPC